MDGRPELWEAVGEEMGTPVRQVWRVSGGDISTAFFVRFGDNQRLFCKTHPRPPSGMFRVESAGLEFLRVPGGPGIPRTRGIRDSTEGPSFLLLEPIKTGGSNPSAEIRMGEALAALHTAPCGDRFGYSKTNFIGTLEQDNAWMGDWGTFFVERRLRPQVQLAQRILGRSLLKTLDVVMGQAPGELETGEAPCRVHGDLWSGNRIIDEEGEPWVIDPAAFCGNRELDLAMMRLFGGFGEECFSAYEELAPLPPGAVRRTEFYKLYFLLVHVNLHGPSWAGQVAQVAWELT